MVTSEERRNHSNYSILGDLTGGTLTQNLLGANAASHPGSWTAQARVGGRQSESCAIARYGTTLVAAGHVARIHPSPRRRIHFHAIPVGRSGYRSKHRRDA